MFEIKTITCVPQLMNEWGCESLSEFYMFAEAIETLGAITGCIGDLIQGCENCISLDELEDDDEAE